MKIHLMILLFVILAFIIYLVGYFLTRRHQTSEHFTTTSCNIPEYNLLHNGSFQNGKDVKELYQNNGNNKILKMQNPLKCSTYVLAQQSATATATTATSTTQSALSLTATSKLSSYILRYPAKAGYNYKFSLWVAQSADWNCNSAIPIVNFKLGSTCIDNARFSVADKVAIGNMIWQLYEFYLHTQTADSLYIELGNYPPTVSGTQYITGLQLIPYLPSDLNFEYTIGLQTFLDAAKYDGNTNVWEDQSNENAVWSWKNKPAWSQNYFRTNGNILTGFAAKKLEGSKKEFAVIIRSRGISIMPQDQTGDMMNMQDTSEMELTEPYSNMSPLDISNNQINPTTMQQVPALSGSNVTPQRILKPFSAVYLGGNQGTAFEIGIPNTTDVISMNIAGRIYQTKNTVNPQLEHTYTFVYSKKSTGYAMDVWLNDTLFESFANVPIIYFNNSKIQVNRNLNWNANLYNLLFYSVALDKTTIPAIYKYIAGLTPLPLQPVLTPLQPIPAISLQPIPLRPLTDAQVQQACYEDCKNYADDIWKCRRKSANCREMCSRPNFADDPVCYSERPDRHHNRKCPHVECKHGTYYVNRQNYGKDKKKARKLYEMNYPDCPIPKLLRRDHVDPADCPFVVNTDENPCRTEACDGVDWSKDYPTMSKKCKLDVAHYCRKYGEDDPACKCWARKNKDDPKCQKHRHHYEQPENYDFTINDYNINMHADYDKVFDKGVKRGIGMCWGCSGN